MSTKHNKGTRLKIKIRSKIGLVSKLCNAGIVLSHANDSSLHHQRVEGSKERVRVTRSTTTVSHPAELVGSLRGSDPVDGEASLDVIDDPEVLSSLLNLDNVHETSGELGVSPGLAVNLDQTLLHDGLHLLHGDCVLQTVPEMKPSMTMTEKPCIVKVVKLHQ